ncbi:MAG: hypothetical protein K0R00_2471 [Herbinix sp.]|jgi:hypothetical protein|nr:hypothetical protein [Herbinix sp.]
MDLKELGLTADQIEAVNKAIQSETDKVRTDYSLKLKTANDELSKFKPNEKSDAEKALEQKQRELEQKELEIANKEKSYKLKDKLTEKGLSPELAKYLNAGDDLDKFVDELSGTFNNLLVNNGFKPSDHKKSEGITKEQFAKMNYMERAKLQDEKPELYKILSQK